VGTLTMPSFMVMGLKLGEFSEEQQDALLYQFSVNIALIDCLKNPWPA